MSASWIYPVSSAPLENGVIAVSNDGTITAILTAAQAKQQHIQDIQHYDGIIVPGFINTHCHLELSHLAGKIPMYTGLPGFVQKIMQQREAAADEITQAMVKADAEMYANGIVAIGDISNQLISKPVKLNSKIYYHTFIEVMGFNPANAAEIIERAENTKLAFAPLKTTIVPHAPYSVSSVLFEGINRVSGKAGECLTIHNQETAEENIFFETKTGHFLKLYDFLGLDISFFNAGSKTSLQTYLPYLSREPKVLMVHNTFTSMEDIIFAGNTHPNLYWCLCPNANMYIEERLPDVQSLRNAALKITLGTDSLASNHQLSILAEMQTLQEQKAVPFTELLEWATINGAAFLGIDNRFGSLEKGKKPGINLIELMDNGQINARTRIQRLF